MRIIIPIVCLLMMWTALFMTYNIVMFVCHTIKTLLS
jgi:hypothetical protein